MKKALLTSFLSHELRNSYLALAEYNKNADMILRDKKTVEGEMAYHSIEEFAYNSRGNPFKYRRRHLSVMDTSVACAPDASEAPVTEWQYRYAPHQEREQKRQYASASADELAWIYYLIAPNKKSLSKWHGMEGMNCDSSPTVTLWPVEYNTYGPNSVRIITRPDGSREYPICDYLGSVRFTLHESGKTVEGRTYDPFGSTTSREGEGAGTAYTGVETDAESDLGFHGVRLYDSEWGRFLSVDKLWEKYHGWTPYQYALNCPLTLYDNGGDYVRAMNAEARQAIRESVPSEFRNAVQFNDDGFVQIEPLKEAAKGQDVNSNVAILSRLTENEHTIEVEVAHGVFTHKEGGKTVQNYFSGYNATPDEKENSYERTAAGITLIPAQDKEFEAASGAMSPLSVNGLLKVVVNPYAKERGEHVPLGKIVAHELYGHVRWYLLKKYGKARAWLHQPNANDQPEPAIRRAEEESAQ